MKNQTLKFSAIIITSLVIAMSCKKEKSVTPVNATSVCTTCAFCATNFLELNASGTLSTYYAQQEKYVLQNGTLITNDRLDRTLNGYYGADGLLIKFDLSTLGITPSRVSFTYAHDSTNSMVPMGMGENEFTNSGLLNVKFSTTPLINTIADSLAYYLNPYGFTVNVYKYRTKLQRYPLSSNGIKADSVVIIGPIGNTNIKIGANLFESELRNICFK